MNITLLAGDITTFTGAAVVNAANNAGLGGGGVDGAIHRAAGPRLLEACLALPILPGLMGLGPGFVRKHEVRIPTGCAVPTPAFDLPCQWVIHTAGPVWPEDEGAAATSPAPAVFAREWTAGAEARQHLWNCYRRPALVALGMGLKSIAYPAISTGVYGCSQETCAEIALKWARGNRHWPLDVTFYLFPEDTVLAIWQDVAKELGILIEGAPE